MNFKTTLIIVVLAVLALAVPVTLRLTQQQTQIKSKASEIMQPAPVGLFACDRPDQYQIGDKVGRCGVSDANGCYQTGYARYTDNTQDINGDGVADPNDPGDQPMCDTNCAEPKQCPAAAPAASLPACDTLGSRRADVCGGALDVYNSCTSKCVDGKKLYFCTDTRNPNCTTPDGVGCPAEDSQCQTSSTPTPGGSVPVASPISSAPPSPRGAPAGPAKGSVCKYTILDTSGKDVTTGPIYQNLNYQVRVEMTNAGEGETAKWIAGSYKLKVSSDPPSFWGSQQFLPLSEDKVKGQMAVFNLQVTAPPVPAGDFTFKDYALKIIMTDETGAEFGAACIPSQVRVQKAPLEPTSTLCYVLSENSSDVLAVDGCDFNNPLVHRFSENPLDYTLIDQTPGEKTIFVKFFDNTNKPSNNGTPFTKKVIFSPDPQITNIICRQSGAVQITGRNFGERGTQGRSKVKVNGVNASIVNWVVVSADGTAVVTVNSSQKLEGSVPVELTTDDGRTVSGSCQVDTTTVDLTIRQQCKTVASSTEDVDVKIFLNIPSADPKRPFIQQKVSFDKNGKPQGFAPLLEVGRNYSVVVKAPGTLSKRANFQTSAGGTVSVEPLDLPAGDIFPRNVPDGKINAFDTAEMKRQWSLTADVVRTGDLNGDARVNSVDYSCILKNVNKEDEVFTPPAASVRGPVSSQSSTSATPAAEQ